MYVLTARYAPGGSDSTDGSSADWGPVDEDSEASRMEAQGMEGWRA